MHVLRTRGRGLGDGYPPTNTYFCWLFTPDGTGYWSRMFAGQTSCPNPPPDGGGVVVRDHRDDQGGSSGGGVTVTTLPDVLDVAGVQMTWAEVDRLFDKTWKQYTDREQMAVKALALTAPPCPPASVGPPAGGSTVPQCYNYAPGTAAQAIPGTFELLGVPFNIAEIGLTKSPNFERAYTPNNEQRILFEGSIVRRSHALLDSALSSAVAAKWPRSDIPTIISKLSAQAAFDLLPSWRLSVYGMAIQSTPPRAAELTGGGGYASWRKRGFLISLDVAEGREKLMSDAIIPQVCTSIICKCGDNVWPACIGSGIPTTQDNHLGGSFWVYSAIDSVGGFHLILKHDDPSWIQKLGGKLESFMTSFGNAICELAPTAKAQTANVVADKYIDKDGKPCVKGAAGCNLVQASAASSGGVGLFNFAMGKWCGAWAAEQAALNPAQPVPPVPQPPPVVVSSWTKLIPWIIGGLALGGGVAAFARR